MGNQGTLWRDKRKPPLEGLNYKPTHIPTKYMLKSQNLKIHESTYLNLVVVYIHWNIPFSPRKMFSLVRKTTMATPGAKSPNLKKATLHDTFHGAFSFKKGWKKSVSPSVMSDSLQPRGLKPARLVGPWNFPGKNTGVGCHFLLQGIFPTQELNPASEKINVDYTWSKAFIKNMEIWVLKDEEMLWLEAEKNGVMETGKLHLSRGMNEYGVYVGQQERCFPENEDVWARYHQIRGDTMARTRN